MTQEPPSEPLSNALRLSPREAALTAVVIAAALAAAPALWTRFERFQPAPDYRVPYTLANDYWHYKRWVAAAAATHDALVFGDSVVWGEYVAPGQTLSHELTRLAPRPYALANLGLDGAHPVVLDGLVRCYGRALAGRRVVLHLNLLWMSSKRRDLRARKAFRFNHPRLAPQFWPRIPCYRASLSERLGIAIEQRLTPWQWARHLRVAYYGGLDAATWSLDHPYECPVRALGRGLPAPRNAPPSPPRPWTERGMSLQDLPWPALDESLQWRFFKRLARRLVRWKCDVFVVVGPFNEHLLTPASRERFRGVRRAALEWLRASGFKFYAPTPLPSAQYADASHPLAAGYAALARALWADAAFQAFSLRAGPTGGEG